MIDLFATTLAADDELDARRIALDDARAKMRESVEALRTAKAYRQARLKDLTTQVITRREELDEAKRTVNKAKVKAAAAKYAANRAYRAYLMSNTSGEPVNVQEQL